MAKTIWYSQALADTWKAFNKYKDKLSAEEFLEKARQIIISNPLLYKTVDGYNAELKNLNFWYADYKRTVKHIYFKNKQLRDCLEKIEIKDLDEAKRFLYENGNKEELYDISLNKITAIFYRFIIHIPCEKQGYAFEFTIFENNTFDFFFSMENPKGKKELPMLGFFDETTYYKEIQQYFLPYSLDVEANIVSLCSNCHNKIHYGQNAAELVTKLYELRKSELEKCNINISLDELLELYK